MATSRHLTTSELALELNIDLSPSPLVAINQEGLKSLSEDIKTQGIFADRNRSRWDDPLYWNVEDTHAERSQYFAIGNTLNFRFWKAFGGRIEQCGGVLQGVRYVGSMYMWRCLRVRLSEGFPLLDASFLASINEHDFHTIFRDDNGENPLAEAGSERLHNLRNLGVVLKRRWGGSFYNLVKEARGSLVRFVKLSQEFRAFDDPLFKLPMVNAILHSESGLAVFDADPLPGIDYHIARQLLRQGILYPVRELAIKLIKREFLTGIEAFELRRSALCALVTVSKHTGIPGDILDNRWWDNRINCKDTTPVCTSQSTASLCLFARLCTHHTEFGFPMEETRHY